MTPDEYLAFEERQVGRHEYIRGEVFAMAGATLRHNDVTFNVAVAIRAHLRASGGACRQYGMDVKLRIEAANAFFYPDAFVVCDEASGSETQVTDARLVVEVLSASTEAYDRGDKFAEYRKLASLQEYVLIDSRRRRVDTYRREADGTWILTPYDGEGTVQFVSVNLALSMDAIYDGVSFEEPQVD